MTGIRSIGWWIPEARRDARQIARDYGLAEEAVTNAGLRSHPVAGDGDHPSTMGARATRAALDAAGLAPDDLDLLIFAGVTRDRPAPWVAAFGVLHELGAHRAAGFDLASRCAGGLDALWIAKTLIDAGTYRTVAVCCADRFDYLMGPPRPPELATDAAYSAGGATVLVTGDAANDIAAFSNCTNEDLTLHRVMCPPAGGSRRPVDETVLREGLHRWHGQLSVRDVANVAAYSAAADRYNYPRILEQAGFDGVDFVVCSPLHPEPQLAVLRELGVDPGPTPFTIPVLGHIGPADLFLILGVAIALGRNVGPRLVLSTRTPVYSNAIAVAAHGDDPGIYVRGEGLDLAEWAAPQAAG